MGGGCVFFCLLHPLDVFIRGIVKQEVVSVLTAHHSEVGFKLLWVEHTVPNGTTGAVGC